MKLYQAKLISTFCAGPGGYLQIPTNQDILREFTDKLVRKNLPLVVNDGPNCPLLDAYILFPLREYGISFIFPLNDYLLSWWDVALQSTITNHTVFSILFFVKVYSNVKWAKMTLAFFVSLFDLKAYLLAPLEGMFFASIAQASAITVTYLSFMFVKNSFFTFFSHEPAHLLRVQTESMLDELKPHLFGLASDFLQITTGYGLTPSKMIGIDSLPLPKGFKIFCSIADSILIFVIKKYVF